MYMLFEQKKLSYVMLNAAVIKDSFIIFFLNLISFLLQGYIIQLVIIRLFFLLVIVI